MDETERLCNRITFVDKGRFIALDVLENLKHLITAGDLLEIGVENGDSRVIPAIKKLPLINSAEMKEQKYIISSSNGSKALPGIVSVFEHFSLLMSSISIHSPSLEDIFIWLTGNKLTENETGGTGPVHSGGYR